MSFLNNDKIKRLFHLGNLECLISCKTFSNHCSTKNFLSYKYYTSVPLKNCKFVFKWSWEMEGKALENVEVRILLR